MIYGPGRVCFLFNALGVGLCPIPLMVHHIRLYTTSVLQVMCITVDTGESLMIDEACSSIHIVVTHSLIIVDVHIFP